MAGLVSRIKGLAKTALVGSRLLRLAKKGESGVLVLRYHSVQPDADAHAELIDPSIVHAEALFDRQMEYVARRLNPVSLDEVVLALEGGRAFPKNAIAVTFDDGFADNFHVAAPILKRYSVPATFYLTVESVQRRELPWFCRIRSAFFRTRCQEWLDPQAGLLRPMGSAEQKRAVFRIVADRGAALSGAPQERFVCDVEEAFEVDPPAVPELMMDWSQARSLLREGHIVGSHTMTHPNVAHVGQSELCWELTKSKEILEAELASPCTHFSYPHPTLNPQWSAETVNVARAAGYRAATTTTYGPVRSGDDPHAMKRIVVPQNMADFGYAVEYGAFRNLQR